ncbi:MAG: TadE/TadG family type IV pilus assembly protein [Actinomycetota bacterium]
MEKLNSEFRQRGSVLVTIAVLMPVFILMIGFIIDIGRAFTYKADLNKACMIAAEEAAKCIDMQIAMDEGRTVLDEQFKDVLLQYFGNNIQKSRSLKLNSLDYEIIDSMDNPRFIRVFSEAEINCYFLKAVGIDIIRIHSSANGRIRKIK